LISVALNNSSLILAGRKKRSVSGDVAGSSSTQLRTSSQTSEAASTKLKAPVGGDLTLKKTRCDELSCDPAASPDTKSSAAGKEMSGTVAKVAERRKSELTLTIKCSQAKSSVEAENSVEEDPDEDDDDSDSSSSSSSSSSNSEDELTSKHTFSSSVDQSSRTKLLMNAKTTAKKQLLTDSDSSQGSSDTEARRNVPPSSSSVAASGSNSGGRSPSKGVKRRRSTNLPSDSCKRRRTSSTSKVGCK